MNAARIEQLQNFIKESPNDPFLLYALALEYKQNQSEEARKLFEQLLREHPSYLPTYYHAALLFARLGEDGRAQETFEAGIALAREQAERHALSELQNAYTNWQYGELDDELL